MKHFLLLVFCVLLASCGDGSQVSVNQTPVAEATPVVIVVGDDISPSLKERQPISVSHLQALVDLIQQSGRRAVIAFGTIGNPTDAALSRLTLAAIPKSDPDATLSQQGNYQQQVKKIRAQNKAQIEAFFREVERIMADSSQYTDVNGFLHKAMELASEPQYQRSQKYIFLHSDGLQSISKKSILVPPNCTMPSQAALYLSGWESEELCKEENAQRMESVDGFVAFLGEELKKPTSITLNGEPK